MFDQGGDGPPENPEFSNAWQWVAIGIAFTSIYLLYPRLSDYVYTPRGAKDFAKRSNPWQYEVPKYKN